MEKKGKGRGRKRKMRERKEEGERRGHVSARWKDMIEKERGVCAGAHQGGTKILNAKSL